MTLATMTIADRLRIIANVGLGNIEIFGTLIAIFVGINLVHKEMDRRTIFTIITRPIRRYEFILGKYLGLILTLLVEISFMVAIFYALVIYYGGAEHLLDYTKSIWLIFVQIALITSIATLFSSLSSPILSGMFTLAFYIIGSISSYLEMLATLDVGGAAIMLLAIMRHLLPDFSFFNIKGAVLYGREVSFDYMFSATAYGFFYIALVLAIAIIIFEKRDMK